MEHQPTRPDASHAATSATDLQLQTLGDLLELGSDLVHLLQREVDLFKQTPNQPRDVREKTLRALLIRFDQIARSLCRTILLTGNRGAAQPAPGQPARAADAARAPAPKSPAIRPAPRNAAHEIATPLHERIAAALARQTGSAAPPPRQPPSNTASSASHRDRSLTAFGPLPMPGPTGPTTSGTGPPRPPAR